MKKSEFMGVLIGPRGKPEINETCIILLQVFTIILSLLCNKYCLIAFPSWRLGFSTHVSWPKY